MSEKRLSRREFIRLSTLATGGVVLGACAPVTAVPTAAPQATTAPAATVAPVKPTDAPVKPPETPKPASTVVPTTAPIVLQWWDHFSPLEPLHKKVFDAYTKANPTVTIKHTVYNPPELGKALQLAFPNKQAPDIHTTAGINFPLAALVKEGWFIPLDEFVDDAWKKSLPSGSLLEGVNMFGGKIYTFPNFTFRQYTNVTWYNKKLATDAGVDPAKDFLTWDGMRAAVKKITEKGKGQTFGWIEGIGFVDRMADHIRDIAMAAGAPGEIDYKTGEFQFATDPFVNAIEWWSAMAKDGSLFPASSTLDMRNARARWVTGVACVFFDGPWNPGAVVTTGKEFMDLMGVLPCPTPNGKPGIIGRSPMAGDFFLSSQSKSPKHAAALLKTLVSESHQIGLAERMDQPPLDPNAIGKANVHPTYKEQIKFFADSARLVPQPQIRNPLVNDVNAEMKNIEPNLGQIIQGVITGDVKDVKKALKEHSDARTKERERAIKVVQGKGGKVSIDDWIFSDWTPGQDYVTKSAA